MALLTRKQPAPAPAMNTAAQVSEDLDQAWERFRSEALEARARARKEQRQAARRGETIIPLILEVPEPPGRRPTWFGAPSQPRTTGAPTDRDGHPIEQDQDGRLRRVSAPAPAIDTTTSTFYMPDGSTREREVSVGLRSGDEPAEDVRRIDPAALYADLHGVSLEQARDLIAAEGEE